MATTKAAQNATNKYKKKFDNCMIYLPPGTAAAVREQGASVSGLCNELIMAWLEERGVTIEQAKRSAGKDQQEKETKQKEPKQVERAPGTQPESAAHPVDVSGVEVPPVKEQEKPPVNDSIIDIDTFL